MIPFDFQYAYPETIEEAVQAYQNLDEEKLMPIYYGGGTEIISQARKQSLTTKAIIDLKGIPECRELGEKDGQLIFGAGCTLTEVVESELFPFLGRVCRPIADRTIRNKITIGGNICGRLPYREAILPLLIVDAQVVLVGPEGVREVPVQQAFNKRLLLNKGEFLLQIKVPKEALNLLNFNRRREKQTAVDYPILHLAAVKGKDGISVSFSGVSALPFRSLEVEEVLNQRDRPVQERVSNAIEALPLPIKADQWASSDYRKALLEKALFEMFAELEGVSI